MYKYYLNIFFALLLSPSFNLAQEDTTTVNKLNELAVSYKRSHPDSAYYYATKAIVLAEKIDFKPGIIMGNINAGMSQCYLNKFASSLPYLNKALVVAKSYGNPFYIGEAYFYQSQGYRYLSSYGESIASAIKALKTYESIHYINGIANAYNSIANVYYDQENFQKARQYFLKTISLMDSSTSYANRSTVYLNTGLVYSDLRQFDSAMYFFNKSLVIREKRGNQAALADVYTDMGVCFSNMGNYEKSLEYLNKAADIYEEKMNEYYLGIVYTNIGDVYLQLKNYKEAEKFLLNGLSMSEKIDDREGIKTACATLASLYSQTREFEKAFRFKSRYIEVKDSLMNQRNQNQIAEIQTKYETDKRDQEIELLNKDKQLRESLIEKQNAQRLAFITGIVFLMVILLLIGAGYRRKQRDNRLISRQKDEVEKQKSIIEAQKKEVELKQKEVMDSINYAQRIQKTLLPSEKYIDKNLGRLSGRKKHL